MTVKMKAVLIPNSSMPSAASSAPIILQCGCSMSPEAPRVAIEFDGVKDCGFRRVESSKPHIRCRPERSLYPM